MSIESEMSPEQAQAEFEKQQARLRELSDLRAILATVEGRRFAWGLLERAGVFRQVFAGEDTHLAAFRDGNRTHGLRLFADIQEGAPLRYIEMVAEAQRPEPHDAPPA